jgi:hypothetical protein
MKEETLKRIFDFLEKKEGHNPPVEWKLKSEIPLNVKGELDLKLSRITSLPEGLEVEGDLMLYASKIKSLPKGLEVYGNIFIHYTPLAKYTDNQLREMIKPGSIKGKIYR